MTVRRRPPLWRQSKLKDVCSDITVGHVGPMASQYVKSGIPFLRSQNIEPFRLNQEDIKFISDDFHAKLKKSALKPGDVAVVRTGYPGTACVIPDNLPVSNCADLVVIRPSEQINARYLAAIFNSTWGRGAVAGNLVGVAQQHFNIGAARELVIDIPPKITQDKIAGVLSAYDDLIENYTRRITILEEMAQAIYREWFVHFRFPGHERVRLIDSPLGKISEGWKPKTIGSVLHFQIGGGWGKDAIDDEFSNRAFVIRGTDIPEARSLRVVNCPLRYHTDSNIRSRKLIANDLVFEVSGGSKGQPVGRCLFVSDRLLRRFDGDVICASFCKLIRADPSQIAPEILYHYLLESYTNGIIEQYEVQSTGIKNFKFTVFLDNECITVPPADVQEVFVSHVRPMMDQIHILGKKSEILGNTRDLLLPKLISGQLDVEELAIETGEPLVEAITMDSAERSVALF